MFTINEIKEAHSKVKSGADFPNYIQDLIALGVKNYTTFVTDGHSEYFGEEGSKIQSEAKYAKLKIEDYSNPEQFKKYLKIHQEGQTDYMAFCKHSAETGVECWKVDLEEMTCTYYDDSMVKMHTEKIPG